MAPPDSAMRRAPQSGAEPTKKLAVAERELLTEALREAAPLALEHFRPGAETSARVYRKSDGSSVTEADLAVNEALKRRLMGERPDHGWLSEEDAETDKPAERGAKRSVFVLDPIDGTRSFIEGRDAFCLSLALVVDGLPLAAAVYAPAMGRMFDAAQGCGARLNDSALWRSDDPLAETTSAMALKRDLKDAHWTLDAPETERRYLQPIAHRLCAVAAGEADGLIALKDTQEWDIAAADLIAREAGLTVTDVTGEGLVYNKPKPLIPGLLAAPAPLHSDWLARGPIRLER